MGQYDQLAQTMANDMSAWFLRFDAANVGTWTPAFSGTLTLGAYTYTVQQGFFTRLGNIVHVWGRIAISAIGTAPTGVMVIFGLPRACSATAGSFGSVSWGYISNLKLTAGTIDVTGLINTNESQIRIEENFNNANSAGMPAANFINAVDITFLGSYPI